MNTDDRMDRCQPRGRQEKLRPALTAAERSELEAEARVLIAKIRRLLERRRRGADFDDNGNMGVRHDDFRAGSSETLAAGLRQKVIARVTG
jgi:hypothetical protein